MAGRYRTIVADPPWPYRSLNENSALPIYDLVEQASPGPYLEMFSRRARLGWDTWGDEALNHVEIAS